MSEDGRNLRIVSEVMDETEVCESCGVDTGGSNVKLVDAVGSILKIVCHDCFSKEKMGEYRATGRLTSRIVMDSLLKRSSDDKVYGDVAISYARLQERIRAFGSRVWGAMRKSMQSSSSSGMSLRVDGLLVLTFETGGRVMLTISSGDSELTMMAAAEDDPRMGLHGIEASEEEAVKLMEAVEAAMESGASLSPDGEVSI